MLWALVAAKAATSAVAGLPGITRYCESGEPGDQRTMVAKKLRSVLSTPVFPLFLTRGVVLSGKP